MKTVQRAFVPGSKWLYIKIYSGVKTAEELLFSDIQILVRNINKQQWIDKWFFIRYADPEPHLRFRFLLKEEQYASSILYIFCKKLNHLVCSNQVWKIQTDTYNRELERYGEFLIEEAESLFCVNSDCTLRLIQILAKTGNENYRWMIALKMIDFMLSNFSLSLQEKQQIMEELSSTYKNEFGFTKYNAKQFNTKFREHKVTIESVLNNTIKDEKFSALYRPLIKQSKQLIPIIEQIRIKIKKQKSNTIFLNSLLKSYIHMMLNRLLRSECRAHELIMYDFMRRYYVSEMVKLKNINNIQ